MNGGQPMPDSFVALVRICMYCRRIFLGMAEDREVWVAGVPEDEIPARCLTHGLCPECLETRLGPELEALRTGGGGREKSSDVPKESR